MQRVFTQQFSDTHVRSVFRAARFGARTRCPRCGYARKLWVLGDGRWRCKRCETRFGLTTDTWLARSRFALSEIYELLFWFELELTDHGIARRLKVPYHRVHRFLLDVRRAIAFYEDRSISLLDGEVEVDESYFGPRLANRRRADRRKLRKSGQVLSGRGAHRHKQAVFGIYERTDGIVYVQPVPSVSKRTLQSIIHQKVTIETTIYSDAWPAYEGLAANYAGHETVSHGTSEWVRGTATINGIEGFWAYAKERLLKHHGVSPNHFLLYLKEMEYRFNHRHLASTDFVNHLVQVLLSPIGP
jgi:transposase-like protein